MNYLNYCSSCHNHIPLEDTCKLLIWLLIEYKPERRTVTKISCVIYVSKHVLLSIPYLSPSFCFDAYRAFTQSIVDYMVEAGAAADKDDVKTAAAGWGFELPDGATTEDFFMAIGEQYGWNFSAMDKEAANVTIADTFPAVVLAMSTTGVETGESADHIAGIVKTGDYSMTLTLTEFSAPAIEKLALPIAPMHYYGDKAQYDFDNNKFGFPKNDLSLIREKTTKPLGAGPFTFKEYSNKVAYLEANENFYLGAPGVSEIQFKETQEADKVPALVQGTADIAEPSFSKATSEQISSENSEKDLVGDTITTQLTDYLGYGYIGGQNYFYNPEFVHSSTDSWICLLRSGCIKISQL